MIKSNIKLSKRLLRNREDQQNIACLFEHFENREPEMDFLNGLDFEQKIHTAYIFMVWFTFTAFVNRFRPEESTARNI